VAILALDHLESWHCTLNRGIVELHLEPWPSSCCCRLSEDKKRLLKELYDKKAHIHHLENLLAASEGRNSGLVSQTESAKAHKLASEKRMHALEAHAAELESKLSRYRGKMDSQLKARCWGRCAPVLICTRDHAALQRAAAVMSHTRNLML
jgi:hypothetical protein